MFSTPRRYVIFLSSSYRASIYVVESLGGHVCVNHDYFAVTLPGQNFTEHNITATSEQKHKKKTRELATSIANSRASTPRGAPPLGFRATKALYFSFIQIPNWKTHFIIIPHYISIINCVILSFRQIK